MVYVNPAYTVMPASGEAGLTYRNQFPGIPATFVTYGASLVVPVKPLQSGFGISITNDVQGSGVISRAAATLMYGFLVELDRNWKVGAGIGASWVMKNFNGNELVLRSDLLNDLGYSYGNTPIDNYTRSYPDFSVGIIAQRSDMLSFGVSASHVTRPRDAEGIIESRMPLKYTAFASMNLGNSLYSDLNFRPAIFYSYQNGNQEIIWGTLVDLSSKFLLGSFLRHNTNFNFDALILTAGISWEKYNISYSYDVNLKKLSFLSTKMAAHEVTFLYRFEYKDEHKVKRFRKSECPAY
jgi:type IX secretion system PorP/SprF family membrane protein